MDRWAVSQVAHPQRTIAQLLPRRQHEHVVTVPCGGGDKGPTALHWEFKTLQGMTGHYDIGFELIVEAPGGRKRTLVPMKRQGRGHLVSGQWPDPSNKGAQVQQQRLVSGRYIFRWDNSYSRLRQKTLEYHIWIQHDNHSQHQGERAVANNKSLVMNNYLGIGVDAAVALAFHRMRAANPALFAHHRLVNKLVYMVRVTPDHSCPIRLCMT